MNTALGGLLHGRGALTFGLLVGHDRALVAGGAARAVGNVLRSAVAAGVVALAAASSGGLVCTAAASGSVVRIERAWPVVDARTLDAVGSVRATARATAWLACGALAEGAALLSASAIGKVCVSAAASGDVVTAGAACGGLVVTRATGNAEN